MTRAGAASAAPARTRTRSIGPRASLLLIRLVLGPVHLPLGLVRLARRLLVLDRGLLHVDRLLVRVVGVMGDRLMNTPRQVVVDLAAAFPDRSRSVRHRPAHVLCEHRRPGPDQR